jgi:hypothetical protein
VEEHDVLIGYEGHGVGRGLAKADAQRAGAVSACEASPEDDNGKKIGFC